MEKEKEFFIDRNGVELSFLIEDISLWKGNIQEIEENLVYFTDSIMEFKSTELNLLDKMTLNLSLCDESRIQEINSEHRNKNKTTDVLSFPLQENVRAGEFDSFDNQMELGDIIICSEVCDKQAREFGLSFVEEFLHLATHGFLHLLGFDHEISDDEEKLMEKYEEKILLLIKEERA